MTTHAKETTAMINIADHKGKLLDIISPISS